MHSFVFKECIIWILYVKVRGFKVYLVDDQKSTQDQMLR